jgi:hypothetical protein
MSDSTKTLTGNVEDGTLYCANHPDVPTMLRCKRCEKPICAKCAVSTPTGYICKECTRNQQKIFETAQWYDYPVTFLISAFLAGLGSFIGSFIWFFIILLAPAAGVLIAEAVRAAVSKRRSRLLWQVMAAGIIVGCLPMLLSAIMGLNLWSIVFQGVFVFTATTTAIARLRGINIR